ncbi:hypothetical protein Scep_018524 [Stephania cephalantha]|uniref:Uncharacterized protein n=1 Tax=Stephania cephalantha TaxID=152367 RepID=A0AAP0I990_9MAGN
MAKFSCFSVLAGKKKKDKVKGKSTDVVKRGNGYGTTQLKLEIPAKILPLDGVDAKMLSDESPLEHETVEADYEGGDEHDEKLSMKRDFSDFDLQAQVTDREEDVNLSMERKMDSQEYVDNGANENYRSDNRSEGGVEFGFQNGHASDPGVEKTKFWASPLLKRSCSNLETGPAFRRLADQLPVSKSQSYEDLENLRERMAEETVGGTGNSPLSVMTPCSADRVMLKKHSSSQVLPSRSRKLWWKLFLWSHRNMHKPKPAKPKPLAIDLASDRKGGYCSDTLEPTKASANGKSVMEGSCGRESRLRNQENFHGEDSGLWPLNQWVAFPTEPSSLTRMWIDSLQDQPFAPPNEEDNVDEGIVFPPSPENGASPARSVTHMSKQPNHAFSEDVLHANNVIQSLNVSSTVAHIAGMSLKIIPIISHLSSLRSVNLSGNLIVRITPGSLPKGLHVLNLSKNKISAIEGLRELTRLRVLDLSYNRISRIGQGLSNSTLIKELYLAGNKISDVEGLHRLLKLTVLDLSFNKITTTKALGQLVANYNSLLALNLLGNPIQNNIGDDQLRKVVPSLLPQLAYLNKQPIKPQRAREVATDSVAKAALGGRGATGRRKVQKRLTPTAPSSSRVRSNVSNGQRSRHTSRSSTRLSTKRS